MSKIEIGGQIPHFKLMHQNGNWIDIISYIGNPIIIYKR